MVHGPWCNTKTFPIKCRLCGASVFFFSCDHESRVFFEELGPPWPVHDCQDRRGEADTRPSSWPSIIGVSVLRGGQNRGDLLPGLGRSSQSIDSTIVRRISDNQNRIREIMRIEPLGPAPVQIIGVVQARGQPDLSKRYKMPRTAIGYDLLTKQIGDAEPLQFTVFVDELASDPAAVDYFSYTFLCPRHQVDRRVSKGAIIQVSLVPIDVLGVGRLWCAKTIERLH